MIGRLAVAQLRAHRVQSAWTLGLLTLLAAIVTAMLATGTTQQGLDQQARNLMGGDHRFAGGTGVITSGEAGGVEAIPLADLNRQLAALPGSVAVSTGNLFTEVPASPDVWMPGTVPFVAALSNPDDAAAFIRSGRAPATVGEIAVTTELAARLHATLGTQVTLYTADPQGVAFQSVPFTVVGITTSASLPTSTLYLPDAIVSWDELSSARGIMTVPGLENQRLGWVEVHWDGHSAFMDGHLDYVADITESEGIAALPADAGTWFAGAIALVVAMVIMAFAVGRSQAASRTQWVGTARVLGASSRYVAAASIVETLFLAVAATMLGLGLGLGAAQGITTGVRATVGEPLGGPWIAVGWLTVPIVAAVVLAVSLIVAAVPAFWAARVPPSAALKPVNDVTEAQISRNVSVAWVWLPFLGSIAAVSVDTHFQYGSIPGLYAIGAIGVSVTGFVLFLEGLRVAMPRLGSRLARSRSTATMLAGDALRLRPRQAVAPATIVAIAAALGTVALAGSAEGLSWALANRTSNAGWTVTSGLREWRVRMSTPGMVSASLAVAAMLLVVLAAIGVAHRTSTAREFGALRALGAPRTAVRHAYTRQAFASLLLGAGAGVCVAALTYVGVFGLGLASRSGLSALFTMGTATEWTPFEPYLWQALLGAVAALPAMLAFVALASAVAAVVARATTPAMPVGSLASES